MHRLYSAGVLVKDAHQVLQTVSVSAIATRTVLTVLNTTNAVIIIVLNIVFPPRVRVTPAGEPGNPALSMDF